MLDAYLYAGLRSPFGRHGGSLAPVRADDLVAKVMATLVARAPFRDTDIEDVLLGCTNQAGEDSRNVARHAVLLSGLPPTIPGATVNRLCASGLEAIIASARAITCGEGELYIAGGVESMSRAPFAMAKSEAAYSRDVRVYDTTIGARFPNPRIAKAWGSDTMPQTGDNVAKDFGITREDSDRFAAGSQAKYAKAKAAGFFAGEIVPIEVPAGSKSPPLVVAEDEHPRPQSSCEALAKLKPLAEGGVVTAGNASGINDGAVAMFIGSRALGERYALQPIARILSAAAEGVEPCVMGIGPAFAIPTALKRAGLALEDMDVIEINEAFAPQVLGCLKLLKVAFDDARVNPNGGAIAVGHPLGASGARIALSTARELQRSGKRYGIVSLCIGVGQGLAMVIERA